MDHRLMGTGGVDWLECGAGAERCGQGGRGGGGIFVSAMFFASAYSHGEPSRSWGDMSPF